MKSYASVDRIEGKYTVLEVELLDIDTSKITSSKDKDTIIIEILTNDIISSIGEINVGDIIIVENQDSNIIMFYGKDNNEKQRRIEILNSIMNK